MWLGEGAPPEGTAVTKEGELLIPPCENNTPHTPSPVCHRTHCRGGGGGTALNPLPKGSGTHRRVTETETWRV